MMFESFKQILQHIKESNIGFPVNLKKMEHCLSLSAGHEGLPHLPLR